MTERAADAETEPLRCLACEYVLVGLDERGRCPECGLPIDESLRAVGGWSVRRLRIVRVAAVAMLVAIPPWLAFSFILWDVAPAGTSRLVATGCVALHAISLAVAAIAATLAASRRPRPQRLAIVVAIVGLFALLSLAVMGSVLQVPFVARVGGAAEIALLGALVRAIVLALALWLQIGAIVSLRRLPRALSWSGPIGGFLVAVPWFVFGIASVLDGVPTGARFDRFGTLALWSDAFVLSGTALLCIAILHVASRRIALRTTDA